MLAFLFLFNSSDIRNFDYLKKKSSNQTFLTFKSFRFLDFYLITLQNLYAIMSATTSTFNFGYYTQSKLSLIIFGGYMLIVGGIGFCFFPHETLELMNLSTNDDVFVRLVGVLLATLSINYFVMVYHSHIIYFKLSVIIRYLITVFFVYLVVTDKGSPDLLLFGLGDAVSATWTLVALWYDGRSSNVKTNEPMKEK